MRYAWIAQQVRQYPLLLLCDALSVSVNGYRAWKRGGTPGRKRLTNTQLLTVIRTVHVQVKGACGSPRMTREIRDRGYPASKSPRTTSRFDQAEKTPPCRVAPIA